MLKIKQKHHISLPHIQFSSAPMVFEPVTADDDELTSAINNDPLDSDNNWQLNERPDTNELVAFWTEVEQDVANDPKWFKFSED
jgi:hypothetical protein